MDFYSKTKEKNKSHWVLKNEISFYLVYSGKVRNSATTIKSLKYLGINLFNIFIQELLNIFYEK